MSVVSHSQDLFAALRGLDVKTTQYIISELWPCQCDNTFSEGAISAIASYWRSQFGVEKAAAHCINSIDDLQAVATIINHSPTLGKAELAYKVRLQLQDSSEADDQTLANSIELVTRLLFMVDIQSMSPLRPQSLSTVVPWQDGMSLADVLQSRFPHSTYSQTSYPKKFTRIFNVYNLEKIGGFRIQWTNNLVDHLMFEDNTIYLFPHVSLLYCMKQFVNKDALPLSFFNETLDSLSLLLPRSNRYCVRWFQKEQNNHFLDCALLHLGLAPRDISHYSFWGERLQILEEEFATSEPRTFTQWWFDKRKRVQWYTFWVAVLVLFLTVLFGVIQTTTGIIQAWASIQSMKTTN